MTSSPRSLHSIFWHNQAHQSPKSLWLNFAFISLHPKTTAVEVSATVGALVGNGSLGAQSCGGPLGQLQLLGVHEDNAHSIPLETLFHSLPPLVWISQSLLAIVCNILSLRRRVMGEHQLLAP